MNKGKLIWHVACDESGVDGARYYGFGSLWMKWQRRGDFSRDIRKLREKHAYTSEIKWQKAHSKLYSKFYDELLEYYRKTTIELATQYISEPKSLTGDELERIIHEAGKKEIKIFENHLPPDDLILCKLIKRSSIELSSGLKLFL